MHIVATRLQLNSFALIIALLFLSSCSSEQEDRASAARSHLNRSEAYLEQGQYRAAIIEAKNIIQKDSQNPAGYIQLASIQEFLGGNQQVIQTLTSSTLDLGSESHLLLAKAYANKGKFTSAKKSLETYKNSGGDSLQLDYKLIESQILAANKQYDQAFSQLQRLTQEHPEDSQAGNLLTLMHLTTNNLELAEENSKLTLEKHLDNPRALYLSARISYSKNDLDKAESQLTASLIAQPETDIMLPLRRATLSTLSKVLTEQGRTTEAIIYSKVLAEANPEGNEAQTQFNRALSLIKTGDIEAAELLLSDLNKNFPQNTTSGLYLGLLNYQKGDYKTADQLLSKYTDPEIASEEIIEAAALSKLRLQKTNEALAILNEALKHRPNNKQLQTIYALTALESDTEHNKGALLLEKITAENPENTDLRIVLARHYIQKDKQELAQAQLIKIIKDKPSNIAATKLFAQVLQLQKKSELAEKAIQNLINNTGGSAPALNLAAQNALFLNQPKQAAEYYKRTLKTAPNNSSALKGLIAISLQNKNAKDATTYSELYISADPSEPTGYKGIITAFELNDLGDKAITTLENYIKKFRKQTATPACVLAEYYLRNNQPEKALGILTKDNTSADESPYKRSIQTMANYSQFKQASMQKLWPQARQHLVKAMSLSPNNERLIAALIDLELSSQQYNEAQTLIDEASEQFPNSSMPILAKASLLLASENKQKAIDWLTQNWQTTPTPSIALRLSSLLEPGAAAKQQLLKEWEAQQPNNPKLLLQLATEAQLSKQTGSAINYYKKTIEVNPNNVIALNNLAWLYHEENNPKAIDIANTVYTLAPKSPAVLDTVGWILFNNGEKDKAIAILKKAVDLAPDNQQILGHLEEASK